MITRKSLATVEARQTFQSDQLEVDGLEHVCRPVVEPVEAAAWSETLTPLEIVIALHVPRVRRFRSSARRLPHVSHARWNAFHILQLYSKSRRSG